MFTDAIHQNQDYNFLHFVPFQADDKSILARFYYADRALTAVASELDSFDGRAEPERCSRLVGRLRQGQVSQYAFALNPSLIAFRCCRIKCWPSQIS